MSHRPKLLNRATDSLEPCSRNALNHSETQIEKIAASIDNFGFINPIIVDRSNVVVSGHGRLLAAKRLNLATVPTILVDHLSDAQIRAYRIADNRLAELSDWDDRILVQELQSLSDLNLDFALDLTGFDLPEIDQLLSTTDDNDLNPDDDPPPEVPNRDNLPVTVSGDLWCLGDHRLICGDARDPSVYELLMGGSSAVAIITDPPFNVPISGHVSGKGRIKHGEFVVASGEMSNLQFEAFLTAALSCAADVSKPGSVQYVFMDWRGIETLLRVGGKVYGTLLNLCVWSKTNGGMGSFYRSQHELIAVFKKGDKPHINNVQLGKFGRNRTNVWTYPGCNSFGSDRDEALAIHPTVKPVAMIADAIRDCSHRNDVILDPFVGSGTLFVACERTGRIGYGIELDPYYVDTAIRRWQRETGEAAIHAPSGETFESRAIAIAAKLPSDSSPATEGTDNG